MTLLHMDGFDSYADETEMLGRWDFISNTTGWEWPAGRFGGKSFKHLAGASPYIKKNLDAAEATIIIGFAFKASLFSYATSHDRSRMINFYDGTQRQGAISIGTEGIAYYNGDLALIAGPYTLTAGTWVHVEVKITFHATAGAIEFRLDNTSQETLTSVDTVDNSGGNQITTLGIRGGYSSTNNVEYDDYYLLNTSGSLNNDFLGDSRIDTTRADGDSAVAWTKSSGGSNYLLVDETTPNDDTDYVYSSTATQKDLYDFAALPAAAGTTAAAICVSARARKENAGGRWLKLHTKDGANLQNSGNKSLSVDYRTSHEYFETYDGTNQWTKTKIDDGQFGMELV